TSPRPWPLAPKVTPAIEHNAAAGPNSGVACHSHAFCDEAGGSDDPAVGTDQKAANGTEAAGRIHHRSTNDGQVKRRRGARGQNGIRSGRRAAIVHDDLSVHVS